MQIGISSNLQIERKKTNLTAALYHIKEGQSANGLIFLIFIIFSLGNHKNIKLDQSYVLQVLSNCFAMIFSRMNLEFIRLYSLSVSFFICVGNKFWSCLVSVSIKYSFLMKVNPTITYAFRRKIAVVAFIWIQSYHDWG